MGEREVAGVKQGKEGRRRGGQTGRAASNGRFQKTIRMMRYEAFEHTS
jgi:ribosomal protein L19E